MLRFMDFQSQLLSSATITISNNICVKNLNKFFNLKNAPCHL